VLATGGTKRAYAALDYIPDIARMASGEWESIDSFAKDDRVWRPVLAQTLSPNPADNPLYQLVKGNIGSTAWLTARKAGRAVADTAKAAGRAIVDAPDNSVAGWARSTSSSARERPAIHSMTCGS
jgi:hypothetical protein